MGVWGVELFSNDTTSDIRDTYIHFLKQQLNNEEAYQRTCKEYEELIGTEDEPLFWYAMAETQWNEGRLKPEVKRRALEFIQKKAGFSSWQEIKGGDEAWKIILQNLKKKIESPMPRERKYCKEIEFKKNPWSIGDVYAYQFHSDKSMKCGLFKKYILLQKIGNVEYFKGVKFSVIQVYNLVFDSIPSLNIIEGVQILPLVYSPIVEGYPSDIAGYVPNIEWFKPQ